MVHLIGVLFEDDLKLVVRLDERVEGNLLVAFLCWHASAKHWSWGRLNLQERQSASMAEMEGSHSCCHHTSLRPQ